MSTMRTTAENITSEEDLKTFVDCYERVYGKSILTLDFVRECDDVYLFRDQEGTPVGGYTINTKQAYRTLDFVPAELAAHFLRAGKRSADLRTRNHMGYGEPAQWTRKA